jgi:hypothetical protein
LLVSLPDIASGILYMAAGDKAEPFLPGVIGAGPEVLPVVRARDAVAAALLLAATVTDRRKAPDGRVCPCGGSGKSVT